MPLPLHGLVRFESVQHPGRVLAPSTTGTWVEARQRLVGRGVCLQLPGDRVGSEETWRVRRREAAGVELESMAATEERFLTGSPAEGASLGVDGGGRWRTEDQGFGRVHLVRDGGGLLAGDEDDATRVRLVARPGEVRPRELLWKVVETGHAMIEVFEGGAGSAVVPGLCSDGRRLYAFAERRTGSRADTARQLVARCIDPLDLSLGPEVAVVGQADNRGAWYRRPTPVWDGGQVTLAFEAEREAMGFKAATYAVSVPANALAGLAAWEALDLADLPDLGGSRNRAVRLGLPGPGPGGGVHAWGSLLVPRKGELLAGRGQSWQLHPVDERAEQAAVGAWTEGRVLHVSSEAGTGPNLRILGRSPRGSITSTSPVSLGESTGMPPGQVGLATHSLSGRRAEAFLVGPRAAWTGHALGRNRQLTVWRTRTPPAFSPTWAAWEGLVTGVAATTVGQHLAVLFTWGWRDGLDAFDALTQRDPKGVREARGRLPEQPLQGMRLLLLDLGRLR